MAGSGTPGWRPRAAARISHAGPSTPITTPQARPARSGKPDKVSREMRKLLIDGNEALGGSGSRKRRKLDVEIDGDSPLVNATVDLTALLPSVSKQQERGSRGKEPAAHPARHGLNNSTSREDPSFWFMPDGNGTSTPVEEQEKGSRSEDVLYDTTERVVETLLDGADNTDAVYAPAHVDDGQTGSISERKRAKSTKVSRELRRLRIDANPLLTLQGPQTEGGSAIGPDVVTVQGQPSADKEEQGAGAQDNNEAQEDVVQAEPHSPRTQKRVDREIRKLRIDANPVLSAVIDKPEAPGPRRSGRVLPLKDFLIGNVLHGRRRKPVKPRYSPPPRRHIEKFPSDPPDEFADQILLILAMAAEEDALVRALSQNASDAIALGRVYENEGPRWRRIRREIAIMEKWDIVQPATETSQTGQAGQADLPDEPDPADELNDQEMESCRGSPSSSIVGSDDDVQESERDQDSTDTKVRWWRERAEGRGTEMAT